MRTLHTFLIVAAWGLTMAGGQAQQPVPQPMSPMQTVQIVPAPTATPTTIIIQPAAHPTPATPPAATVPSTVLPPAVQAGTISRNYVATTGSHAGGCSGGYAPIQMGQYGRACANGCGSFAGNCGFIFGSCRSFFDPCGPLPLACPKCPIFPFGKRYGAGYNGCQYDSYLNH